MGAFCLRYLSQIFRNLRHIIVSISLGANTNNCHYFAHTQFYPDRAVQRDVMEMLVKCENHSMGCPWTGQLKNWEVRREGDNVYVGWKGEGKDRYVEDNMLKYCCHVPLSSLPHRTTLMRVSTEQLPVPTRDVRQCYHTTNWSHMNKTAPSGE